MKTISLGVGATLAISSGTALALALATPAHPQGGPTPGPAARGAAGVAGGAAQNAVAQATGSATWSVQGPSGGRWVLRSGRDYEVIVTAGDNDLGNLALAGSTLQSTETGARLGVALLELCSTNGASGARGNAAGDCTAVSSIQKKKSVTAALRIHRDSAVRAGTYTGTLSFAADGGEGLKPLELRVENTTGWRWFFGGLAIATGVLLSWLLMVLLRQGATHAAALFPATQLRRSVEDFRKQVRSTAELTEVAFPLLGTELDDREEALEFSALAANGLPPRIPNPFTGTQDGTAAYQQYLAEQEARISTLAAIVRIGLGTVAARWPDTPEKGPLRRALRSLDQLAPRELGPDEARTEVNRILGGLDEHDFRAADEAAVRSELPSAQEVLVQLQRISLAGWGISLVVTILAGLVVLVVTNHGFGTVMDYIKCIFWGLGLPFVTQQMQQLSPASVFSTLKFSLPK